MRITKYGHCCLFIEEGPLRVLTDPAVFSSGFDQLENMDVILITHEHSDHLHIASLKAVLANNPQAKVVTNSAVGALLQKESIPFEVLEDGQSRSDKGIAIEAIGAEHAIIYPTFPKVMNTGYFIGGKLFYPGDAFTDPERPVDILAAPIAGPWVKASDTVDYLRALKPKTWVPVHDGGLKSPEFAFEIMTKILKPFDGLEGRFLPYGAAVDLS